MSETKAKDKSKYDQVPRKFDLGRLAGTPGALAALSAEEVADALVRHVRGDWGLVGPDDWRENDIALEKGFRLFSVYESAGGQRFWVITEADRSVTTVLLPSEY